MTQIQALAARLIDLQERKTIIEEQINAVRAELVDAVEVGGVISIGDRDVYKVTAGRRTFSAKLARENLPSELLEAATTIQPVLDPTRLKELTPPAMYDELCCTTGAPSLRAL